MDDRERLEHEGALKELRSRLKPELVRSFESGPGLEAGLLEHLRSRDQRVIFFDPERIAGIEDAARASDSEEWAWERRIADNAVEGLVYAATNPYSDRFVRLPDDFDFAAYDHPDPQAIMGLNRHRWFPALARSYHHRRERRYFDALMREWDFYVDRVPFPDEAFRGRIHAMGRPWQVLDRPPHMELDVFIRLWSWYWAFWLSIFAAEIAPARCALLLARCLRLFDLVASRGIRDKRHNFTAMQLEAIYVWASALPECTGMELWRHHARNSLESSMDEAVWPDGTQWEMSPAYHDGCVRWYGAPALLAKRRGEPFAEEYLRRLRAMGEVIDALQCPDGTTPPLSDSDRRPTGKQALSILRSIFPDLKLRRLLEPSQLSLWLSGGERWEPGSVVEAKPRVRVLPQGGYASATSSTGSRACHLVLDNGPNDAGHSHRDSLAIYWEAFGRPALTDPGRYLYVRDEKRSWVMQAESHNSLLIDDGPPRPEGPRGSIMTIRATDDHRVGALRAEDRGFCLFLSTRLRAWSADPTAGVERTVWMGVDESVPWLVVLDRIDCAQPHRWTTSWLLPAEEAPVAVDGGFTARLTAGTRLALFLLGWEGMEAREESAFWTPNYGEMESARWLRLSSRCTQAARACAWAAGEAPAAPELPRLSWRAEGLLLELAGRTHELEPARKGVSE